MKAEKDPAKKKDFLEAYRKVRKPTAPSERVIPDQRRKIQDSEDYLDDYPDEAKRRGDKDRQDYEARKSGTQAIRARVIVTGKVQGVFFRAQAQEQASATGLTGWVRNRADGSVELTLEGPKEDVQHVIDWSYTGPPAAHVIGVEVFWEQSTGEFAAFETRHTF